MLKELDDLMKARIKEIFSSFFDVSAKGVEVFYNNQGSGVYIGKILLQEISIHFQIFYGQSDYIFELTLHDELLNLCKLKDHYQLDNLFIDEIEELSNFSFDNKRIYIGKFGHQFKATFNYDRVHNLSHSLLSRVAFLTLYPDFSEIRTNFCTLNVESNKVLFTPFFKQETERSYSLDNEGVDAFYKQFFVSSFNMLNQSHSPYMNDMPSLDEISKLSLQEIRDLVNKKTAIYKMLTL